jgi:phage baseplate assembly protein W
MILNTPDLRPPVGWPLLPLPDADGELRYPNLSESVRQNLRVILSTRPGEQLMRPAYGAGLAEFIHEPNTLTTRRRIHDRVTESIRRWESRVELDRVDVASVETRPGIVRVEIAYRLRRTGEARTLNATLELEPAAS